jgi:hypothetical protein
MAKLIILEHIPVSKFDTEQNQVTKVIKYLKET